MTAAEKWNRITELHSKYIGEPEQKVQSIWESIFAELLGYSQLEGEIDSQRNIPTGASNSMKPDLIIKNGNADLFVVELKQHNLPIDNRNVLQLFSYLKQLRISAGVLICSKIYIYDYSNSKSDEEQDRAEIEFKPDNPDGIKFIEIFSKGTFNEIGIREFVREKSEFTKNVGLIRDELTADLANMLLRDYFTEKYSEEEFEQAIMSLEIAMQSDSSLQISYSQMQSPDSQHTANNVRCVLEFVPTNEEDFKQRLLQTKKAKRTWYYSDGSEDIDTWDASKLEMTSDLKGNIRSHSKYKKGMKTGLKRIKLEILQ